MGVDKLEAHACKRCGGHRSIAGPTVRPVADDDIGVKRAAGGVVIKVDAIVERHRLHTGVLDHPRDIVDIIDIIAVFAGRLEVAEAHAAAGEDVVRVLIRAHVKELAALTGKVVNVLLEQRLRKRHGGSIGDVNGAGRAAVGAVITRQARGCVQNGVHVTRRVDAGNHAHALGCGIVNDGVHIALRQLVNREIVVILVARVDRGGDLLAGVVRAVNGQAHVVQQETQAVIADCKLNIIEASRRGVVDKLLDAVNRKVLSAAVKEHDAVVVAIDRRFTLHLDRLGSFEELLGVQFACQVPPVGQSRNGQNADHQDKHEQQGKNSGQILFHGMLSLLTLMCWLVSKQ